jgi:peptidoglycan/LPS O-acetylase OafA/YrhL
MERASTLVGSKTDRISTLRPPSFRPDIEGLRAIAILLVVFFHAGIPWLRGGFVGVDVFFVLSGYLITELLADEVERTGSIDFPRFYARRIRRLLPASLLMILCILLASFTFLSSIETVRISKSAIATAAYVSNMWFVRQSTDYFSANVETNPLLHTWSLAVEEQFYLVWPLLVLLCTKRNRPRKIIIGAFIGVGLLSLAASVWLTRTFQPLAFFSTPTRAWEFAAGGLATLLQKNASFRIFRHAATAWVGAAMIVGAGIWLSPKNGFPGAIALIPVVGTTMVLIAGKLAPSQTGLFALLGSRVFQTLGGLSYSWYLWHWPVLVFGYILLPGIHGPLIAVFLLLLSLAIAWSTHSLIENPIRFNRKLSATAKYSLALGAAMTIGGILSGSLALSLSRQSARSPSEIMFLNAATQNDGDKHECLTGFRKDQPKICSFGPSDAKTVVLFGDSHAEQWLPALEQAANTEPWHVITLLKASCPTTTVPIYNPRLEREEYECARWRTKALDYIKSLKPSVVLISNSSGYVQRPSFQDPYARLSIREWQDGTAATLQSLSDSGVSVALLRDTPRPEIDIPICLARTSAHPRLFPAATCDVSEKQALVQSVWQAETSAAQRFKYVSALDLTSSFCRDGQCPPMLNDLVVYRDGNHITSTFASSLAPILAGEIRTIWQNSSVTAKTAIAAPVLDHH